MTDPNLFGLFPFGISIILFFRIAYIAKLKRLIENTPTTKIRSIAMGFVELYGTVIPIKNKLLKAPLSKKNCVYYFYTVEIPGGNGRVLLKKGEERTNFYLKDDTGMVLVDPNKANIVDVPIKTETEGYYDQDFPEVVKFLDEQNLKPHTLPRVTITEWYIEPKEKIYIIGTAEENSLAQDSAKNEERVIIKKGKYNPYYISTKDESNIVNQLNRNIKYGVFFSSGWLIFSIIILYAT